MVSAIRLLFLIVAATQNACFKVSDRKATWPCDQHRDRSKQQHEGVLEATTLIAEQEAVGKVDLEHGDAHRHRKPCRSEATEQPDNEGGASKKLGKHGEIRERGRYAHRTHTRHEAVEARSPPPAEKLLTAVDQKHDSEGYSEQKKGEVVGLDHRGRPC